MENRIVFSSLSDIWNTPNSIYQNLDEEFHFDFDPCPKNHDFDGLEIEWGKCNFVNPPYSQIAKWIKKGFEEYEKGKKIIFLIPSRTDTRWWHEYVMKAKEIRFIKGRLRFSNAKHNAPFPSCVVIFSN